jgi:glycosyltransferase involved in cell wall biosynthesis
VLSSISEALPLVLLEGFAAGVPCVATDVGACRQLVYGQGAEDEALGAAGEVVQIADPQALADAAVRLLADPKRWREAAAAGIARVERYYTQARMFAAYQALYEEAMASMHAAPATVPAQLADGDGAGALPSAQVFPAAAAACPANAVQD